ncbi:hypothetical protein KKF84_05660 [Myxococcota bacterium]|nr:hypothetical protein [Myxococcota bacterium]
MALFITFTLLMGGSFSGCKKKRMCPLGQKYVDSACKCRLDSNCPTGEVCRQGKCVKSVKKNQCPNVPCKNGQVCLDGACGPCNKDSQCKKGTFCDNGACKPLGNQCSPDKDCPLGQKCLNGYCVKDSGPVPLCSGDGCKPPCDLEPIYFAYKGAQLAPNMIQKLKLNVACLKKAASKGRKTMHLVGMCDPRGPSTFNDDLSSQRIKTVVDELTIIDPGLMKSMEMTTEPLGETCAKGTDENSWKDDRKVVFVWFKKSGQVCP